jgi:hypothetical protein
LRDGRTFGLPHSRPGKSASRGYLEFAL